VKKVKSNDLTTLLLDSAWLPINIITARACFHHFYRDRVVALDGNKVQHTFKSWNNVNSGVKYGDNNPILNSAHNAWLLPTIVIVMDKFFRKPRSREYSFNEMCKFYKNTCQICLEVKSKKELSIEHIVPKYHGGHNFTSNLSITCKRCNSRRGHVIPCLNKDGVEVKGTVLPNNFIFIEESEMREEWKDFIWHQQ